MMKQVNFNPFPILQDDSIVLRQYMKKDASQIFQMRKDEEVCKYVGRKPQKTVEESYDIIEKMNNGSRENKFINWALTRHHEDVFIGTICLWQLNKEENCCEVGYDMLPNERAKGYATKSLKLALAYAFKVMEVDLVWACPHHDNVRSIRFLKKNHFVLDEGRKTDEDENLVCYYMSKEDYNRLHG